ncbi:suppressor of lurcher protein 1-like isoform X1 [Panulirus ornatus]|uniref:suppressor of lurcher protein 1-like isoform X1 n=1 Tax=Panulirus ornatus TaxID=150431 RepID=UPI003A8C7573
MRISALFVSLVAAIPIVIPSRFNRSVSRRCNNTIRGVDESEGEVMSPGYPGSYQSPSTCTLTFLGATYHRVQLIFTAFHLREPPHYVKPHERCLHTDSVAVFNLRDNWTSQEEVDTFCGASIPLPIMSSTPGLQLLFRAEPVTSKTIMSPSVYCGFSAKFKFITNLGMLSGHQVSPGVCQFVHRSIDAKNGTFYSPNPEGYYPQDTTCTYLFYGHQGEVVRLNFKYFDVEGVMPCDKTTDSDYLEFSNFPSADRKIPSYCGNVHPTVIQSDSSYFRVTFKSNKKFSGTGFAADYQFIDMSRQPYAIKKVMVMTAGGSKHGGTMEFIIRVALTLATHCLLSLLCV